MRISITLQNGQVIENFCEKKQATVGRSLKCDFTVQDEALSRSHCLIELEEGEFYITDLDSSNGVFLEGERIAPNVRTRFSTFQQLRLGALDCVVLDDPTKPRVAVPPQHRYGPPGPSLESEEENEEEQPVQKFIEMEMRIASASNVVLDKPIKKAKKISRNAPPVLKKQRASEESRSSFNPLLPTLFFFGILCYLGYEAVQGNPKNTTITQAKLEADVPLTSFDYRQIALQASCRAQSEICGDLNLNENDGEGVLQKEAKFFVILKPGLHRTKEGFDSITKLPLLYDLIALQTFFKSILFSQFLNGRATQVHLILKDDNSQAFKVYKLIYKDFETAINIKEKFLASLKEGRDVLDFSNFWATTKPYLHTIPITDQ